MKTFVILIACFVSSAFGEEILLFESQNSHGDYRYEVSKKMAQVALSKRDVKRSGSYKGMDFHLRCNIADKIAAEREGDYDLKDATYRRCEVGEEELGFFIFYYWDDSFESLRVVLLEDGSLVKPKPLPQKNIINKYGRVIAVEGQSEFQEIKDVMIHLIEGDPFLELPKKIATQNVQRGVLVDICHDDGLSGVTASVLQMDLNVNKLSKFYAVSLYNNKYWRNSFFRFQYEGQHYKVPMLKGGQNPEGVDNPKYTRHRSAEVINGVKVFKDVGKVELKVSGNVYKLKIPQKMTGVDNGVMRPMLHLIDDDDFNVATMGLSEEFCIGDVMVFKVVVNSKFVIKNSFFTINYKEGFYKIPLSPES